MHASSAFALLASVAAWGVSASPAGSAPLTPTPVPTSCATPTLCSYIATTTWVEAHPCPDICIASADASKLCPVVPIACPAEFATCPPGSTHSFEPVGLTSVLGTSVADCTATVVESSPCHTCGCPTPGCTICVATTAA